MSHESPQEPQSSILSHENQTVRLLHPSKFLVCVDSSDVAKVALRFACLKAQKRGVLIDLLHVIQPAEFQSLFSIAGKIDNDARTAGEKLLNELSKEAEQLIGVKPTCLLREGSIGECILKTATDDQGVNMVLLGVSPGETRGKLVSWLCQQMGENLMMPIMLVPGNLTEAQMAELA
jgi:nucleotide-binding universal stress UspA family protein